METCRIYLAGGMTGLSFEEYTKWRNQIKNAILYGDYDYERKPVFFDPTVYYNFESVNYDSDREVMNFDLNALRKSDLLVVNFNRPNSLGTAMEVAIAYENRIPILALDKEKVELHPWIESSCDKVFDNMRDLVDYIVAFYLI